MTNIGQGDGAGGSAGGRVRVLIVDDSALMRRLLSDLLTTAPEIEIAGMARDGREAVAQAVKLRPDVITMDVEMPEVSGLEALPAILAVHEAPVVMVSALTQEGAEVTLQALELGAVDFLPKPQKNQLSEMRASRDLLVSKVLSAAQSRVRRPRRRGVSVDAPASSALRSAPSRRPAAGLPSSTTTTTTITTTTCIVIGISTGGPQALSQVLPALVPPLPPILLVQHMLAEFTGVFAQRLDRYTHPGIKVKLAETGDPLIPDRILVAPGGRHLSIVGNASRARAAINDDPEVSGHRPSIDVLFRTAAPIFQSGLVAVLMTGMGRDGAEGCKAVLSAGGFTLGQDEATSVVYGMNKAAFLDGAIRAQFALDELPGLLQDIDAFRASVAGA